MNGGAGAGEMTLDTPMNMLCSCLPNCYSYFIVIAAMRGEEERGEVGEAGGGGGGGGGGGRVYPTSQPGSHLGRAKLGDVDRGRKGRRICLIVSLQFPLFSKTA